MCAAVLRIPQRQAPLLTLAVTSGAPAIAFQRFTHPGDCTHLLHEVFVNDVATPPPPDHRGPWSREQTRP